LNPGCWTRRWHGSKITVKIGKEKHSLLLFDLDPDLDLDDLTGGLSKIKATDTTISTRETIITGVMARTGKEVRIPHQSFTRILIREADRQEDTTSKGLEVARINLDTTGTIDNRQRIKRFV
jgi:hypothetical protein